MKTILTYSFFSFLFFSAYSQQDSIVVNRSTKPDSTTATQLPVQKDTGIHGLVPVAQPITQVEKDTLHNKAPEYAKTENNPHNIYKLNAAVDVPITAIGAAWSIYAMTKIYNKGASSEAQIAGLNLNRVNSFDRRFAFYKYNAAIDRVSYYPFYAAFPYPFIVMLARKNMRHDFFKITFLYLETMSITGLFGFSGTYFVDKYRPYAYSDLNAMSVRMGQNGKNSFYSGHVEVVAASTFFAAKVYSDYYPNSGLKWVFYGIAGATTASMAYMRLEAAEHFPSDILLGVAMGALTGILVPQLHKHKCVKKPQE